MNAIRAIGERCVWGPAADPTPGAGELLLHIHAAGVNRADLAQRSGAYPPPPGASDILGLECSGVVAARGVGATTPVGEARCALLAGGGYASACVVDERHTLPLLPGMSHVVAASLPEVWATAWLNLVDLAAVRAGERVLVHAGASGVGLAAVQLCRLLGARSFVVVGSRDKLAACKALGAETGVVRGEEAWDDALRRWSPEVDVILDPVGGSTFAGGQRALATGGRWVVIGLLGGRTAQIDLGRLLMKRQHLLGSTLRALPADRKAALVAALHQHIWPALADGRIQATVQRVFPIALVDDAHELMASDRTIGKLVLQVHEGGDGVG